MENELSIGQPVPTAVLTPTEIIAPVTAGIEQAVSTASEAIDQAATPSANLFVEMMFAPIAFWASMSTSYLRLFDLARSEPAGLQRF